MADYDVFLTTDAERDLEEIAEHIERTDSQEAADYVHERIKATILKLETFPSRGRVVPELKDVGITDYREVLLKPYRIIYDVAARRVFVHCICDGRRDAEDVLGARFLR